MQNVRVKFISIITIHSVATSDDSHWMSVTRTRQKYLWKNMLIIEKTACVGK